MYIVIEKGSREHNTKICVYQGMTLLGIGDTVRKVKIKSSKRKALVRSINGALIGFAIWFVASLALDYFSHIGVKDTGLFP